MRDIATRRSASADVPRGHPPEFECRGAGCHDWVLRGELAQGLLVIGLDNREAVRVVVSEDRSEHDHVTTFEIRAPVGSMAIHDLPLRVSHSLGEVRARSDEAQDKGGHAADSTAAHFARRLSNAAEDTDLLTSSGSDRRDRSSAERRVGAREPGTGHVTDSDVELDDHVAGRLVRGSSAGIRCGQRDKWVDRMPVTMRTWS